MTAKEILGKVKAFFEAPVEPVEPTPPAGVDCDLEDGRMLHCSPDMSVGATATIDGQPAPAGDYKMKDGSSCTIGEGGLISDVKAAEPITVTPPVQPPMFSAKTPEELKAVVDAFATGTPEERLAKLEVVAKALMEYSFGWQIREAEQKALQEQAINVYKTGLEAAEKKIEKQDKVIEGLFELAEKLVEAPTEDPKTLTGFKKERFERENKKQERFEKIAKALKDNKALS